MSELNLLEGERLIMDVCPTDNFKKYVTVKVTLIGLPLLGMVNVLVAMSVYVLAGGAPVTKVGVGPLLVTYALLYLVFAVVFVIFAFVLGNLMFKKYHYWVTDQRVIWKHGIIGYRITSVPLERIADVAVSRTFLEKICGVGGVVVKEMSGEIMYGYWYGGALKWPFPTMIAVLNPEEVQSRILELIRKKGKESKLTI